MKSVNQFRQFQGPSKFKSANRNSNSIIRENVNPPITSSTKTSNESSCVLLNQKSITSAQQKQEVAQQLECMAWNLSGSILCGGFTTCFKIWEMNQSILKQTQKKEIPNFKIEYVKFSDQHVFGGLSSNGVKFWDLRENSNRDIFSLHIQNLDEELCLFDIHQKTNQFVIGTEKMVKNYDFRYFKTKKSVLGTIKAQLPIRCVHWVRCNQILLAGGGIENKGILSFYNERMEKLLQLDILSAAILSIFLHESGSMLAALGGDNILGIFEMPQVICQSTIFLPEQIHAYDCQLSPSKKYVSVGFGKEISVYKTHGQNEEEIKNIDIKKYSPQAWHPSLDILCYLPEHEEENVRIMKF